MHDDRPLLTRSFDTTRVATLRTTVSPVARVVDAVWLALHAVGAHRWRDGYDGPPVWMEKDRVYRVTLGPMQTSNWFAPGHRIRIEVSSSNFPRFDRNLNTGGNNYDETEGVVAHNAVHHSRRYPSSVTLTVVPR